ncbi:MAG: hypothetical protein TREMPRED_002631 [Tremellales sp. Tagirdzhanova-0007]|nr:MAG: hypothetical protein TREMPRED_002631 [Tremellales sp. Tagirdzhanova-0007]
MSTEHGSGSETPHLDPLPVDSDHVPSPPVHSSITPLHPTSESPPTETSTSSMDQQPRTTPHLIQVYTPSLPSSSTSPPSAELDDTFFEPTLSDVQAHHASVVARSRRLNEAPLLTSKYREQDQADKDKRKADKWPMTTIRVKFSDGTQVQSAFPSTSPIQPVYTFVRSTLDSSASSKPFILWQPPRTQYPEQPLATAARKTNGQRSTIIPPANYGPVRGGLAAGLQGGTGGKESLSELGLVPQSVLLVRWEDEAMNVSGCKAPLLAELMERSEPLPVAVPKGPEEKKKDESKGPVPNGAKKIPKYESLIRVLSAMPDDENRWMQKGLMKKK